MRTGLSFLNIRKRVRQITLFITSIFISFQLKGQELELKKEIDLPFYPVSSSIDQSGNVYLVSERGLVVKYSSAGDSLLTFSPKKNSPITLLDASSGLRPFIFYKEFQEYIFLDQYLTAGPSHSFYPELVGFAENVAVSSDNNLWLVDANDFSIKKYNLSSNILDVVSPLDLIIDAADYQIDQMKEYQNLLFIYDKEKGLFLFDTYGSLQKRIALTQIPFINFFNESIYYPKDGYLVFMNIYSGSKVGIPMPYSLEVRQVLRNANNIYLIEETRMGIYTLREGKK